MYDMAIYSNMNINLLKPVQVSLVPEYIDVDMLEKGWTANCVYVGCFTREQQDAETGEAKNLTVARFIFQNDDGSFTRKENASAHLVGNCLDLEKTGLLRPEKTLIQLVYKGKQKNKTNSFSSAKWDIFFIAQLPDQVESHVAGISDEPAF